MTKRTYNQWNKYLEEVAGEKWYNVQCDETRKVAHPAKKRETDQYRSERQRVDVFFKFQGKEVYGYSMELVTKNMKYPCIGGPLGGTKRTLGEAEGYLQYNSATRQESPKMVLVHPECLGS